jgi:hypothetical protein
VAPQSDDVKRTGDAIVGRKNLGFSFKKTNIQCRQESYFLQCFSVFENKNKTVK